jgi:tRNA G46 methylase TrmB
VARQALVPDGVVYLRTDDRDYFEQMVGVFGSSPQFHSIETPPDLAGLQTDFEKEFNERGIQTLRAAYKVEG